MHTLQGDASKARKALKWAPKVDFEGLVKMMVESDMEIVGTQGRK